MIQQVFVITRDGNPTGVEIFLPRKWSIFRITFFVWRNSGYASAKGYFIDRVVGMVMEHLLHTVNVMERLSGL